MENNIKLSEQKESVNDIPQENVVDSSEEGVRASAVEHEINKYTSRENVVAGVVGAFLLSLVGGALYFLIYQAGFIAGICGLIIFVLANFGYQKFAGVKDSMKGTIVSIIMLVVIILLAEYLCLSFEIFNIYKEEFKISFFDAVASTPAFLAESEVLVAVIKDVLIALALGAFAAFSTIRNAIKVSRANQ